MKLLQPLKGMGGIVLFRSASCLLLFSLFTIQALAQQAVSGKVTDAADGEPLIGVSIMVKGTGKGTITGLDGDFELALSEGENVLLFTFVGYKATEVEVNGRSKIDMALEEDVIGLEEITVTALGIEREKKALGYAVQDVSGEELSAANGSNFVSSLAGRAAGVQVVSSGVGPGQSASVVIRGASSLSSNNQPLFVVDGIPVNNDTDSRTNTSGISSNMNIDYGNSGAEINPDDIESIAVLKGANATALYGSRAANGAIIITTKSGKKRKGIGVTFNSKTTFESVLASPEYQRVYGQGKNEQFAFVDGYGSGTFDGVDESWGPRMDGQLIPQYDSPTSTGLRGGDVHGLDLILGSSGVDLDRRGTIQPTPFVDHGDPVEQFFETGRTLINNLSFYGGNDQGNFRLSLTNLDNKGMLPNTDLRRNTVSFSGEYKLSDRLRVNAKTNYIRSDSDNRHVNGYGTESIMYLFIWLGQQVNMGTLSDYWQRGLEGFQQFNYNYNYHDNPYFTMFENTNGLAKDRLIGNVSATYDITNNLSLMLRAGRDQFTEYRFIKRAYSTQRFPNGQYREDKINYNETNIDFLLNYDKQVNDDFFVSASFGGNRMIRRNHFNGLAANKLIIPGVYSFTNADGPLVQYIDRPEQQINSLYAFAQVGYKNYLYLDLTARNDWSSTLPKDNNSYFYPSVSLSAIISDMLGVPTTSTLSFAKLRLGWAQVGSDTDPYRLADPFFFGSTAWGSNGTISPSNTLPNFDLKPEIQTSYEVGTDLRFFGNRFGIDAAYYYSSSKNQILAIDLPHTSGKTSRIINAGEIVNQGVELLLSATPVKTKSFSWNTLFNFSLNRNEIKALPEGVDQYVYGGNGVTLIAEEGGSLGDMYGTGLKKVEDPASPYFGRTIFSSGLPVADEKLVPLGNYNPDFILGVTNELSFKNFSLSFLFDWRQGGDLLSRTRLIAATSGNVVETLWGRDKEFGGAHPGISDSGITWVDESDGATYNDGIIGDGVKEIFDADGKVTGYEENDVIVHANAYHNKRYRRQNVSEGMYDATFVKLREARLSYSLPNRLLNKTFMTSLKISLIGSNLALWAKDYNHGDPELLSFGGSRYIPGVENATVPTARSVGFSLNIGL
ncbi:MAG: SusC/RagA family TonB-linked outer membrane protein [Phaeodactylibacter sp.]|nr:SusC/RagA family TonB-linked outer membrane protein [Phaeodactylibacter sp.]